MEQLNKKIDELKKQIEKIEKEMEPIDTELDNVVNEIVINQRYGQGKIISQNNDVIEVEFGEGIIKKFRLKESLIKGFLTLKNNDNPIEKELKKEELKQELEKQICSKRNEILELEEQKRKKMRNTQYENEEVNVEFNEAEAEDVTSEMQARFRVINRESIRKVLKQGKLYKIFFSEGYTAFGQTVRYARKKVEVEWYSEVGRKEHEEQKNYINFAYSDLDWLKWDGVHIPTFIDIDPEKVKKK